jgi:hypothetical protein
VILSVVVQKDTKVRHMRVFSIKELTPNMPRAKLRDKSRIDRGGHAGSPGENGRDFFFGPPTAPNSFKRALKSLRELMELPVFSPDSGVSCFVIANRLVDEHLVTCCPQIYEAAREASDALRTACNVSPIYTTGI